MFNKTSSEIQEIFGLCRDDVKRLEKDGVLNPAKSGQGKASKFGEEDMSRLLDIKMYLLAGYRISDMKRIITDNYDSDEGIAEQIHVYKKRIQMLEFIRVMKADYKKIGELSPKQLIETGKVSAEKTNMPTYGSKEYFDIFWDYIKLVFIVDFLSQRESLKVDREVVLNRAYAAYIIVEKILKMSGTEINRDEIREAFVEMANTPIEDDQEIKEFAKELVGEYLSHKEQILEELTKESIAPITDELDAQAGSIFKDIMNHFFRFTLDYFVDEEELYCVYLNFRQFVNGLDQENLATGIVRLGGKK